MHGRARPASTCPSSALQLHGNVPLGARLCMILHPHNCCANYNNKRLAQLAQPTSAVECKDQHPHAERCASMSAEKASAGTDMCTRIHSRHSKGLRDVQVCLILWLRTRIIVRLQLSIKLSVPLSTARCVDFILSTHNTNHADSS